MNTNGQRLRTEVLKVERAEYGKEILSTVSKELGWSHFVELLPLKKHLQRDFYAELCRLERWSVRMLRQKIGAMLYLTELPPKKVLEQKLHDAVRLAQARPQAAQFS